VDQFVIRYLEESRILSTVTPAPDTFQSADSLIAASCLTYLSFPDFGALKQPTNGNEATELLAHHHSPATVFLSYATSHWFQHATQCTPDEQQLRILLRAFLNPRKPNATMWWQLFWFSRSDSAQSTICPSQFSPIHFAAYLGLENVIPILSDSLDLTATDHKLRSPLWWAVTMGHLAATQALLNLGFDPTAGDVDAVNAFHRAAAIGYSDILRCLLNSTTPRPEGTLADKDGWTPLHWSAARGHMAIAKMLLDLANDHEDRATYCGFVDARALDGRTPLHVAALNGHADVIKQLDWSWQCLKPLIDSRDNRGATPLHLAAQGGHLAAAECLVLRRAEKDIHDHAGKSPADYARLMQHDAMAAFLARGIGRPVHVGGNFDECASPADGIDVKERSNRLVSDHGLDVDISPEGCQTMRRHSLDSLEISLLVCCING
jgi:ankyrin repeat protein